MVCIMLHGLCATCRTTSHHDHRLVVVVHSSRTKAVRRDAKLSLHKLPKAAELGGECPVNLRRVVDKAIEVGEGVAQEVICREFVFEKVGGRKSKLAAQQAHLRIAYGMGEWALGARHVHVHLALRVRLTHRASEERRPATQSELTMAEKVDERLPLFESSE